MDVRGIRLALVAGVLFASGPLTAADTINGAFGMTLGQPFKPNDAIGRSSLTDGTPMYQFKPEKQFRSFSRYYVMITPQSNRVHTIWAVGSMENTPSCKKEQALVMSILQKKYGKADNDELYTSLYDIKQIDQGDRYVLTKCSGFSDVSLDIRYFDTKLKERAEKERIVLESEKVDSSGL